MGLMAGAGLATENRRSGGFLVGEPREHFFPPRILKSMTPITRINFVNSPTLIGPHIDLTRCFLYISPKKK